MSLKNSYPHPYIAREGHPYIILMLLICWGAFFIGCWFLNIILYFITVFVIQFFRDPPRNLPNDDELSVVSPADGKVIIVEKTTDPFRQQEALKISIFMNVFNVHSNRVPVAGVVEKVEYYAGSFLNAAVDKASSENERNAILLKTSSGQSITFVQVAGLIARRILCYAKKGDEVSRGERYGFIRFGSRVDLYLPVDAESKVVIGDKVKATSSVLAQLSNQEA
ncbi:MAG: phosphatidylserine decarboxylase [Neisseriaceae bacterium]|nr:phosphatidylserine decarboxylase [Neisseriaceae bacterium]MCV2509134.1 phosphatidylserine decarboxylase [Neisseriaceae bacterium]